MKVRYLDKVTWLGQHASTNFWDGHWAEIIETSLKSAKVPRYLNHFLNGFSDPNARILEAGCGTGGILKGMLNKGFKAEGVDTAEKAISVLKKHKIPAQKMDVLKLTYPDNIFDGYISLGVIEHFIDEEDSIAIIKEAIRVTKKGGRIFCSVPFTNLLRHHFMKEKYNKKSIDVEKFYQRSYTQKQYLDLFKNLPVEVVTINHYDCLKGISDSLQLASWMKKKPFYYLVRILETTPLFRRLFSHMISVELKVK